MLSFKFLWCIKFVFEPCNMLWVLCTLGPKQCNIKMTFKQWIIDMLCTCVLILMNNDDSWQRSFSYLGKYLQGGPPQTADVEQLRLSLEQVQQMNVQLTKENEELKQKVRMDCLDY